MKDSLEKAVNVIVKVADPNKIILFGSKVMGKEGLDSDFDLLVLKKGVKKPRKLAQKIYLSFKNIGSPVDVIVTDLDRFELLKKDPYLVYSVADKTGKVVYEKP